MSKLLIIGSGLAGYTLARECRKLSSTLSITVITEDDGSNYSKPMLSNGLAKNKTAAELASQSAEQMATQLEATVLTHQHVTHIDAQQQHITLRDAQQNTQQLDYDQLVLAVGASQITLPIEGDGAAEIISVNSLADYAVFREKIQHAKRVALMGPGLIGCEFANDLASIGLETHIIGPDKWPLQRLVPEEAGQAIKAGLDTLGNVHWQLEKTVSRVDKTPAGLQLTLSDQSQLQGDLVVSAAGLAPNAELAKKAGVLCQRGIVVDRQLNSSQASIYALGDCIEMEGLILPYVMPIMTQARALAKTLTGTPTAVSYPAMPVAVKTPAHPIVVSPPKIGLTGEWKVEPVADGVKALYYDEHGKLAGLALTGSEAVKEKQRLGRELPKVLD